MIEHPVATAFPVPETDEAAIAMLEQLASLDAEFATIEATRASAIAATNAVGDTLALPIIDKKAAIVEALAPWWAQAAPRLTKGKRKSIELGGCKIGTKSAGEKVEHGFADDAAALAAVAADAKIRAAATSTRRFLDKKAIAVLLTGKSAAGATLKLLGFRLGGGTDTFYVTPIVTGAGATVAD
ncbi:host-nuclease inhibitor Gam family protein [uncultured Sphingomonas sp.]|uniref:host-nuclease inhibitor Gam family protein n=1 Tax=uncultured Sphingomonas sp. TaxID=158754 RepID=UPI0025E78697|nr:host-nuclease inhibitor Gam family protein [uncultured Sphingomonas sp.]